MNILDLKRKAHGGGAQMPSYGGGGPGGGDGGNDGGGGVGNGRSGGGGFGGGSNGGDGGNLGLGNYGSLSDDATGYNPTTGYTSTQTSAPAPTNYGYSPSTANTNRTNVGINGEPSSREKSLAATVDDFLKENVWARALPFANVVGLAAKVGVAIGGTYTDSEVSNVAARGPTSGGGNNDGATRTSSGGTTSTTAATGAAPSVVDALAGTLNLSNPSSGWGDYVKNTLPGLQSQANQATERGNAAFDTAQSQSGTSMGLADMMNKDYTNIYRPFGQKMANEVNNLNSEGYLSQQRGKAMADVQQQSDAQMQSQQRNLQRMGVNPSSGRALAMGNQNAIATAAAKAGAAGQSDAFNKQNYLQGLSSMNNFGSTLQTQARANNSQAMDWSKYGLASGITGLGAGMDLSKLTTSTANTYGGLANNTQQVANGATQISNQQSQYNNSNDLGNLAKSALVGTAIKGLGSYVFGSPATSTASTDVPWYMQ